MMTALLAATVGLKAYSDYAERKAVEEETERQNHEEVMARNAEAQQRVTEMEFKIAEMASDPEALQVFIDESVSAANEVQMKKEMGSVSENALPYIPGSVSGNMTVSGDESVSGNMSVSGNLSVSGNMSVSGNATVSGNMDPFAFLLGSVSGNQAEVNYYAGNMTGSSIFDEWRFIYEQPEMTLEERKALRTSYQETLEVNQADREWIAENKYDFSEMKIACLGDSITAATNLENEENYLQYSYPQKLQELLGAEEVFNLGIGGSSIGRYWSDAFVDRYTEIPEDTDIIIVMGGTNDGFCASDDEFGSLEEREYRTFCGDLDELMRGLREKYPDAVIFFATPLPNVLQDCLMSEREYLLPQKKFVDAMKALAKEYGIEVIDLYNSNILDSHDANVIAEYMPDGVHGSQEGYQVLAEHFAGEIVKYYNEDSDIMDSAVVGSNSSIIPETVADDTDTVTEDMGNTNIIESDDVEGKNTENDGSRTENPRWEP